MDRTDTTTGKVNGTPGRTELGGPTTQVIAYSRLELPTDPAILCTILAVGFWSFGEVFCGFYLQGTNFVVRF